MESIGSTSSSSSSSRKRRRSTFNNHDSSVPAPVPNSATTATTATTTIVGKDRDFTKEEHRSFVSAVYDVGLKESSPLSVMDQMSERSKTTYHGLNLERIKSKLQKYRKKKQNSKEEYMALYDETLTEFCNILPLRAQAQELVQVRTPLHASASASAQKHSTNLNPHPHTHAVLPPIDSLASGEVAAYLTFSVMAENRKLKEQKIAAQNMVANRNNNCNNNRNNKNDNIHGNEALANQSIMVGGSELRNDSIRDNGNGLVGVSAMAKGVDAGAGSGVNTDTGVNIGTGTGTDTNNEVGGKLIIPKLTQAEQNSPIGRAFGYFFQLFVSIEEELQNSRNAANNDNHHNPRSNINSNNSNSNSNSNSNNSSKTNDNTTNNNNSFNNSISNNQEENSNITTNHQHIHLSGYENKEQKPSSTLSYHPSL